MSKSRKASQRTRTPVIESGDQVRITWDGLLKFNRQRTVSAFANEFSRKLGKIYDGKKVGVVERVFTNGDANVDFGEGLMHIYSYMLEKVESAPSRSIIDREHAKIKRMLADPKTTAKTLKRAVTTHLSHEEPMEKAKKRDAAKHRSKRYFKKNPDGTRYMLVSKNGYVQFSGSKKQCEDYRKNMPQPSFFDVVPVGNAKTEHGGNRVLRENPLRGGIQLPGDVVSKGYRRSKKNRFEHEQIFYSPSLNFEGSEQDFVDAGYGYSFTQLDKYTRTSGITTGRNPVPEGKYAKLKKATERYENFRDQPAKDLYETGYSPSITYNPDHLMGRMTAILYTTVRAGKTEKYRHDFKKDSGPLVYLPNNKKPLIHTHGGHYTFTDRGFMDFVEKRENGKKPDFSVCTEVGVLDAFEIIASGKKKMYKLPVAKRPVLAVTASGDAIISLPRSSKR